MWFRLTRFAAILCVLGIIFLGVNCSKKSTDGGNGGDGDNEPRPAPAKVTDLRVADSTTVSVLLTWTVPTSDATHDTVAWYDFRYYTSPITTTNWAAATQEISGIIKSGGTADSCLVSGLASGTRFYFALKCGNKDAQWSDISNIAGVATLADMVVSFPDQNLEAVVREALDKPTGEILSSEMTAIVDLWGDDKGITNLSGLEHCVNLQFLKLTNDTVSDLTPLAGLKKLYAVGLYHNRVSDISPLAGLTNLGQLNLAENHITDISPLSGLTKLEVLSLGRNPIGNIASLAGLAKLTFLDVSFTGIKALSPVAGLTNLVQLNLGGDSLTDISPLAGLIKLETLTLSGNQIGSLAPLAGLTKLTYLDMINTGTSDLGPLAGLTKLQRLFAGSNQITTITALTGLTDLMTLSLISNQIVDISPLVANTGLGTGDNVDLRINPLSEESKNTHIPALQARGVTVSY